MLGYFSVRDHWVYLYEPAKERIKVETSVAHELAHQLHWHFSRTEQDTLGKRFHASKATWFKEGWAEYISACKKKNGRFEFCGDTPTRMDLFRACRKAKRPIYPVRLLVRSGNYPHHVRSVGINIFDASLVDGSWLQKELRKPNLKLRRAACPRFSRCTSRCSTRRAGSS